MLGVKKRCVRVGGLLPTYFACKKLLCWSTVANGRMVGSVQRDRPSLQLSRLIVCFQNCPIARSTKSTRVPLFMLHLLYINSCERKESLGHQYPSKQMGNSHLQRRRNLTVGDCWVVSTILKISVSKYDDATQQLSRVGVVGLRVNWP